MEPDPIHEKRARLRPSTRAIGGAFVVAIAAIVGFQLVRSRRSTRPATPPAKPSAPAAHAGPGPTASAPAWTPVALPRAASLDALSSGADFALAVGADGVILRAPAGGAWALDASGTHAALHGVAQQGGRAVAVGDHGTVVERGASGWRLAAPVADVTLRAVTYSSYGVVAVGDGGTILMNLEGAWKRDDSGTTADLLGVCAGLREVYVVGAAGTVLRREGFAWKRVDAPTRADLLGVACDDAKTVAVGRRGVVVRREDPATPFKLVASGEGGDLEAVSSPSYTPSYLAVGAGGLVVRATADYEPTAGVADGDLHAVVEGPSGTFAAGEAGLFRPGR